ncbi:MAG: putative quinol monooxygenase [Pseudomonadota bacterium]
MIALTAIITVQPGHEETVKDALMTVARHAASEAEPGTLGYHVGQDPDNPTVFTTYERFRDRAAMEAHNGSDSTAAFFAIAKPLLAADPIIQVSSELFAV